MALKVIFSVINSKKEIEIEKDWVRMREKIETLKMPGESIQNKDYQEGRR